MSETKGTDVEAVEYPCRECESPISEAAKRFGEFNFCCSRCEAIHGLRARVRELEGALRGVLDEIAERDRGYMIGYGDIYRATLNVTTVENARAALTRTPEAANGVL